LRTAALYDGAVLQPIIDSTRARVTALAHDHAAIEASVGDAPAPRDFIGALSRPGLGLIAEIKRRSPSAGPIAPNLDPLELSRAYGRGGAVAISVVTEPDHFDGSLEDLRTVAGDDVLPVLRKDFILDAIQLAEGRAAGADAVLLIAGILDDEVLHNLIERTGDLGMVALVEAHNADEVRRSIEAGASIVGINNRDLSTFQVDLRTAERLRSLVPPGVVAVAESGIRNLADVSRMRDSGFDAVLVGQAVAQADDAAELLALLVEAP
jgi:indole-3-glycerol phosphate synthase